MRIKFETLLWMFVGAVIIYSIIAFVLYNKNKIAYFIEAEKGVVVMQED